MKRVVSEIGRTELCRNRRWLCAHIRYRRFSGTCWNKKKIWPCHIRSSLSLSLALPTPLSLSITYTHTQRNCNYILLAIFPNVNNRVGFCNYVSSDVQSDGFAVAFYLSDRFCHFYFSIYLFKLVKNIIFIRLFRINFILIVCFNV